MYSSTSEFSIYYLKLLTQKILIIIKKIETERYEFLVERTQIRIPEIEELIG